MPPRVLVTGANGFSGRRLAATLRAAGDHPVIGSDLAEEPHELAGEYLACDLTDPLAAERLVAFAQPDLVYHLAGVNNFAPAEVIGRVNVGGFSNLCRALRQSGRPIRMLTIGSAAELGRRGVARLPVTEDAPCQPESPYGESKARITQLALAEPDDSSLGIVVVRPFNLIGPGMDPRLVLANFALQLGRIARRQAETLRCGNLDSRRDFVDVRDAVAAYVVLMRHGRLRQIYNVCAGKSHRIGDLLDTLMALAGVHPRIEVDALRARASDISDIYGDRSKIARDTGWAPEFSIGESLEALWAWARTQT
jgi:nucleoside-diphosphate-sugar epimerase